MQRRAAPAQPGPANVAIVTESPASHPSAPAKIEIAPAPAGTAAPVGTAMYEDVRSPSPTMMGAETDRLELDEAGGELTATLATPLQPVPSIPLPSLAPSTEPVVVDRAPGTSPPLMTIAAAAGAAPAPQTAPPVVVSSSMPPRATPVVTPEPPAISEAALPATPVEPARVPTVTGPAQGPSAAASTETQRRTPPGSALGLGLDRLRVRLDGPRSRTTDRETERISGTLVGGAPTRVVVQVDDQMTEPRLDGRTFSASVKLSPGLNRVRVLAAGAQGAEDEELVTIRYVPPPTSDVALINPLDGYRLEPGDPPLVEVEGRVSATDQTIVRIVANDRRVLAPVSAGRFRLVLPVFEPILRIRAETLSEGHGSATATVHASTVPAIGLSLMDWPHDAAGPVNLRVIWRPNPARLDGATPALPLRSVAVNGGETSPDSFYLRSARPGVYTFSLSYGRGAPAAVRAMLYVAGVSRALAPVTLDHTGRVVIARLLLPQGVLWEQDDWFTGQSAGSSTVTKFRFPDGVSWTERVRGVDR